MLTVEQFAQAYEKGLPKLAALFYARGIREAEELSQAAWARAWEQKHYLRDSGNLQAWVWRIGFNLYLSQIRRMKGNELQVLEFDLPGGTDTQIHTAIVAELRESMHPNDWRPLDLFYLRGLTIEELSVSLGYESQSTARVRLMRSRKAARRIMEGN